MLKQIKNERKIIDIKTYEAIMSACIETAAEDNAPKSYINFVKQLVDSPARAYKYCEFVLNQL